MILVFTILCEVMHRHYFAIAEDMVDVTTDIVSVWLNTWSLHLSSYARSSNDCFILGQTVKHKSAIASESVVHILSSKQLKCSDNQRLLHLELYEDEDTANQIYLKRINYGKLYSHYCV